MSALPPGNTRPFDGDASLRTRVMERLLQSLAASGRRKPPLRRTRAAEVPARCAAAERHSGGDVAISDRVAVCRPLAEGPLKSTCRVERAPYVESLWSAAPAGGENAPSCGLPIFFHPGHRVRGARSVISADFRRRRFAGRGLIAERRGAKACGFSIWIFTTRKATKPFSPLERMAGVWNTRPDGVCCASRDSLHAETLRLMRRRRPCRCSRGRREYSGRPDALVQCPAGQNKETDRLRMSMELRKMGAVIENCRPHW